MKKKNFEPHYQVFTNNTNFVKVGCSYAGKMYYGVAKCAPEDPFSYDFGYSLAKARCDHKIDFMKMRRSQEKLMAYNRLKNLYYQLYQEEVDYEQEMHKNWMASSAKLETLENFPQAMEYVITDMNANGRFQEK